MLPPDWAGIVGSRPDPIPAPSGAAAVQYGLDAARLPIWLAVDCSAGARRLAGRWWTDVLSIDDRTSAIALSLRGDVINPSTNPLPWLAGAAAAGNAGDTTAADRLRSKAAVQADKTSTYYGDAWVALGGALLDRSLALC
jgi:hypothetical protein